MADDVTFSDIAQGYSGAQRTMSDLGLLPGTFRPMDGGGAAFQVPTPPPPQFTQVVSTTSPFPAASPVFAGAATPRPPQFSSQFAPQMPSMSGPMPTYMAPQAPLPPPPAPPQPMFSPGTFWGDQAMANNWQVPFGGGAVASVPMGMNASQMRMAAARRNVNRGEDWAMTGLSAASWGGMGAGAMAGLGIGGATMAGVGAAAGMAVAPLMAAGAWADAYRGQGQHREMVEGIFGGMRMGGGMGSPTGAGISATAAQQVASQFRQMGAADTRYRETSEGGDFTSTLGMGMGMGLMQGHTGNVKDVVARVKTLAEVTRSMMQMGEGITQQDAMELQAIAQDMGIGTGGFRSRQVGQKLVAAARAAGTSLAGAVQAGQAGAQLFSGAGLSAGLGLTTGAQSMAIAGGMAGGMSPNQLAMFGGQSGIQASLAGSQAQFLSKNMSNIVLGSLGQGEGGFNINLGDLQGIIGGGVTAGGARRGMQTALGGEDLTAGQRSLRMQFLQEQMPDLMRDAQSQMTGTNAMVMQLATAARKVKQSQGGDSPLTMFSALSADVGEERARVLMKLVRTPGAVEGLRTEAATVRSRQNEANAQGLGAQRTWSARIGRAWDSAFGDFGVSDADKARAARLDAAQEAAGGKRVGLTMGDYLQGAEGMGLEDIAGGMDMTRTFRGQGAFDDEQLETAMQALNPDFEAAGGGFFQGVSEFFGGSSLSGGTKRKIMEQAMGEFSGSRGFLGERRGFMGAGGGERGAAQAGLQFLQNFRNDVGKNKGVDAGLLKTGTRALQKAMAKGVIGASKNKNFTGLTHKKLLTQMEAAVRADGRAKNLPASVIETTINSLRIESGKLMGAAAAGLGEGGGGLLKGEAETVFAAMEERIGGLTSLGLGDLTFREMGDKQVKDLAASATGGVTTHTRSKRGHRTTTTTANNLAQQMGMSAEEAEGFLGNLADAGFSEDELTALFSEGGGSLDEDLRLKIAGMDDEGLKTQISKFKGLGGGGLAGDALSKLSRKTARSTIGLAKSKKAFAEQETAIKALKKAGFIKGDGIDTQREEFQKLLGGQGMLTSQAGGAGLAAAFKGSGSVEEMLQKLFSPEGEESVALGKWFTGASAEEKRGLSDTMIRVKSGQVSGQQALEEMQGSLESVMDSVVKSHRASKAGRSETITGEQGVGGGENEQSLRALEDVMRKLSDEDLQLRKSAFQGINTNIDKLHRSLQIQQDEINLIYTEMGLRSGQ